MALRSAYKQRLQSEDDREPINPLHAAHVLTGAGNQNQLPRQTGTTVSQRSREVIRNAFNFLDDDIYDAYSRNESTSNLDRNPIAFNDNFTFGAPISPEYGPSRGFGPTNASYDGDAPKDRRYQFGDDQMSYADDLVMASRRGFGQQPRDIDDRWRDHAADGYPNDGLEEDIPRPFLLPRIGMKRDIHDDGSIRGMRYGGMDSYGRQSYGPEGSGYGNGTRPDVRHIFDRPKRGYDRYTDNRYDDYRSKRRDDVIDYRTDPYYDGTAHKKSDQLLESDLSKPPHSTRRPYLLAFGVILALLIVAGVAAVLTCYFLGLLGSGDSWTTADGYEVEAVFLKEFEEEWVDHTSTKYIEEAKAFTEITEGVLNNSTLESQYSIDVVNITKGSTKYIFRLELEKEANQTFISDLLTIGYSETIKNNPTNLIKLLDVTVTQLKEYTMTTTDSISFLQLKQINVSVVLIG